MKAATTMGWTTTLKLPGVFGVNHRFNPHLTGFLAYKQTLHRPEEDIDPDYDVYDGAAGNRLCHRSDHGPYQWVFTMFIWTRRKGTVRSTIPVNISLTKQFQRGSISLSGRRGYAYTSATAENLGTYEYYEAALSADYNFTRRLTGDIRRCIRQSRLS